LDVSLVSSITEFKRELSSITKLFVSFDVLFAASDA